MIHDKVKPTPAYFLWHQVPKAYVADIVQGIVKMMSHCLPLKGVAPK